jgi:hypothetical protein
MNDPTTTSGDRFGVYLFFLAHMAGFGALTFYLAYHAQSQEVYSVGAILILTYLPFYLLMFGADEVLWLAINAALALLMIDSWLKWLALPWLPAPGAEPNWIITDFDEFPLSRHIFPAAILIMYQFLLRNMLIDALRARFNPHRNHFVGALFIVMTGAQVMLGRWLGGLPPIS